MHRLIALRTFGNLNMTKHSTRLILKISYFTISVSELVLRNKIRFVARVRNADNYMAALLVIILLSKKCLYFSNHTRLATISQFLF